MLTTKNWVLSVIVLLSLPPSFAQDVTLSVNLPSPVFEDNDESSANSPPKPEEALTEKIEIENLGKMRGGFDSVNNDQKLSGVVGTNTANNVLSGNNSISSNSFTNSVGIPIVIQNSGANVLIQNSTIINLRMN